MKKVLIIFALLPAFSAAKNMTKEQINECVQVRINQLRESDFDEQHKEDTGMEYPISSDMIAEWEEECKNQEETTKKVEQHESEVDYDEAVNAMNAPYLSYGNGAYAMFKAENECWESIGNATDAERCMAMLMAGAFIEAAWAQKQGRVPVPNYQGDAATKRMEENLAKAKIPEEEKQMARNNFKKNGNRIIPSMINVGALGR
jgi:hypothetical protein